MIRFNKEKLNGRKVKLFCEPQEITLAEDIKILYSDDCIEVFEVSPYSWIDDRAEFACYDLYPQDLPVLLICETEQELNVLEIYKNFTLT